MSDDDRFNPADHIGVDVAWTPKEVKSIKCKKGTPAEHYRDAVVSTVKVLGKNGATYEDQLLFGAAVVSIGTKAIERGDLPLVGVFEFKATQDGQRTYLNFDHV